MRSLTDPRRGAFACALLLLAAALMVLTDSASRARALPRPAAAVSRASKFGIASAKYLSTDPGRLSAVGASWAYNWSATAPQSEPGLAWVPMTWGAGSVTPAVLAALTRDRRDGAARYLLGFNEPDSSSQANLTPAQAAALWPKLEATGLQLGSPAPAVPADGWLAQFMGLVKTRHLRVNFIALHFYQDATDPHAVSELRTQLRAIHRAYGRPIWITEIGAIDLHAWGEHEQTTLTVARARSYMRQLFAMLNSLAFVQRYAWFTDNCWNDSACQDSSLFNAQNRLTRLGQTFRSLAHAARTASESTST